MTDILFIIEKIATHIQDDYSDDLLMAEHLRRGHRVLAAEPVDISLQNLEPMVFCHEYHRKKKVRFKSVGLLSANAMDFIYYRAMPPVEKDVLHATQILDFSTAQFCNAPSAIRNLNEKLMIYHFPDLTPPTLVTSHASDILKFALQHGWPLVVKPLDGYQALGVQKVMSAQGLPEMTRLMMVQPYLQGVESKGSKRVFILRDSALDAITFLPKPGDFRSNYGGVFAREAATLTQKEVQACIRIASFLTGHGVQFSALDFIDGYLMEINITCPGGLPVYYAQHGIRLEERIVETLMTGVGQIQFAIKSPALYNASIKH
ncbi:MAG: hypothetical protein AABZ14_07755 [Candidatus Margulisiibacteriota bacterium]